MMRSWSWGAFFLTLHLSAGIAGAGPSDGILLTVDPGASPDEVVLTWTGNQPTFQVFRSATPVSLTAPVKLHEETDNRTWSEIPPPDGILYYEVGRKPDPLATIVLGAPDRILLTGTVVGPAGFFPGEVLVEGNLIT